MREIEILVEHQLLQEVFVYGQAGPVINSFSLVPGDGPPGNPDYVFGLNSRFQIDPRYPRGPEWDTSPFRVAVSRARKPESEA